MRVPRFFKLTRRGHYSLMLVTTNNVQFAGVPHPWQRLKDWGLRRVVPPDFYQDTELERDFAADRYLPQNNFSHLDFDYNQDVRASVTAHIEKVSQSREELLTLSQRALPVLAQSYDNVENPMYSEKDVEAFAQSVQNGDLPRNTSLLKQMLVDCQMEALRDFANHACTAEQATVAPLGAAFELYERMTGIQHDMASFAVDESKHGEMFKIYLTQTLGHKREPAPETLARLKFMTTAAKHRGVVTNTIDKIYPGKEVGVFTEALLFSALSIEIIGSAVFEFFAEHSPDPLFSKMLSDIQTKDEYRHMRLCQTIYNRLYRTDGPGKQYSSGLASHLNKTSEKLRNDITMRLIAREIFGEYAKAEYPIAKACLAFGKDPAELFDTIAETFIREMAVIGYHPDPKILKSAWQAERNLKNEPE